MCPNESCDRYGVETGLMGGCECGTALVTFKTVDEQINDTLTEIFTESHKRLGFYYMLGQIDNERRQRG